jgi:hypothetical protein
MKILIEENPAIRFLTSLITTEQAKDGRRVYGHRVLPKPTTSSALSEVIEQKSAVLCRGLLRDE